jgi:hypothetical protein
LKERVGSAERLVKWHRAEKVKIKRLFGSAERRPGGWHRARRDSGEARGVALGCLCERGMGMVVVWGKEEVGCSGLLLYTTGRRTEAGKHMIHVRWTRP